MARLLDGINSPVDLKKLTIAQLQQLAEEIREELITVVAKRAATLAPIWASSMMGLLRFAIRAESVTASLVNLFQRKFRLVKPSFCRTPILIRSLYLRLV